MNPLTRVLLVLVLLALAVPASAQEDDPRRVRVDVQPRGFSVPVGGGAVGSIGLQTEQDRPMDVVVEVQVPQGVEATPARVEVALQPGVLERVPFRLNVSEEALPGIHSVRVVVLDAATGHPLLGTTVDLQVLPRPEPPRPMATLQVEPTRVDAHPGGAVEVTVRVANLRAMPGLVRLRATAPEGVTVTVEEDLSLRGREVRDVAARIEVAPDAAPGRHVVEFALMDPLSSFQGGDPHAALVVDVAPAPAAAAPVDARDVGLVAAGVVAAGGGAAAVLWLRRRGWALGLLAPLYTRIARNRVLDQPTRDRIAALVQAEPGITFSDLQRRLGLAAGQLTHHARMLEDAGVVFSTPDGQHRRFFHVGHGRVDAVPPLPERALAHLQREGPMPLSRLARDLGVTRQALHYHVKRLQSDGRLGTDEEGRLVPVVMLTREE